MSEANLIEEWRDVPGWEGYYQVCNLGMVRSMPRIVESIANGGKLCTRLFKGRILAVTSTESGHLFVTLSRGNKPVSRRVHQLVLEAFVGPRPDGMVCRHFPDRDPTNNRLDNIQWGTSEENTADRRVHGTNRNGVKQSPEHIAKRVKAMAGRIISPESRVRISAALRGNKNRLGGKKVLQNPA
jgi:hypothetical protein